MNLSRIRLVLAAALVLAAPALAQNDGAKPAVFAVEGKEYTYSFPKEYCLPVGDGYFVALRAAEIDTENFTAASLDFCGTSGLDYIHIKSPKQGALMEMTKPEFIAEMSDFLRSESGMAVAQQGMDEGSAKVDDAIEGDVSISATEIAYAGQDSDCVYLAGRPIVGVDGRNTQVVIATCLTLIDGRMFSVNVYDFRQKGASVDTLKARSRAIAASIRTR